MNPKPILILEVDSLIGATFGLNTVVVLSVSPGSEGHHLLHILEAIDETQDQ